MKRILAALLGVFLSATAAAQPAPTPVANGGTGLRSATSGGVLGATASGVLVWSGALTAGLPVIGGGAGAVPTVGTRTGNTTKYATSTGSLTNGNCVSIDGSGNLIDSGGVCGGGGGSGTVTAGTVNQLAWYAATGTAVAGLATGNSGVLVTSAGGVPSIASTLPSALTIPSPGFTGTVTGAGTVPNAVLANSTFTIAGHLVSLGGTQAIACADLSTAGTACAAATGVTGHTVPFLDGANTWSALNIFGNGDFALANATSGRIVLQPVAGALGSPTITVPAATDTMTLNTATQTLTNKTISGGSNTITNINAAQVNSGTLPAAQLPVPSSSTLGGVRSAAAVTHQWISSISTSGIPALTQPAFADLSATPTTLSGYGITDAVSASTAGQTFTGGVHPTAFSNGTASSGTKTIDCGNGPIQSLTNGGAFTLAMSANDGSCVVRITNNGSANTVTFSGFSQGSNSGDALTTTNGNKFDVSMTRIGGSPHYLVSALQ